MNRAPPGPLNDAHPAPGPLSDFHRAEMTTAVWTHLLALRQGEIAPLPPTLGPGEAAAVALYAPIARRDHDARILGQIGQSLDGRVATEAGDARDVSGPDGLAHLHRLRALVDAVLIGVRTALLDAPRLTVRMCPGPNPARVIIDPSGRLPDAARVLAEDGARRIVIQAVPRPRAAGVEVITVPRQGDWIAPDRILDALAERGLRSALVEGGGITLAQFLEAGLLSRLHVAVSPLIIGAGPQGLTTPPVALLSEARRPPTRVFGLGSDVLFDCDLAAG